MALHHRPNPNVRLQHALLERPEPLRGRFAYLGDAKAIHYLRPEWIEAHSGRTP